MSGVVGHAVERRVFSWNHRVDVGKVRCKLQPLSDIRAWLLDVRVQKKLAMSMSVPSYLL